MSAFTSTSIHGEEGTYNNSGGGSLVDEDRFGSGSRHVGWDVFGGEVLKKKKAIREIIKRDE